MCGICGILNFEKNQPVDQDLIKKMTRVMVHRGPDDEGFYFDQSLGFGFRRLSIIDIDGGHQPMCNETGDIWVVFNGEIYNHAEIREKLIAKGHQYKSRSDTETIVHLYEEEGPDFLQQLNGMFGIALWDSKRKRLILARDRLGIKPVHYTIQNGSLSFASEIKSLLENPAIPVRPNHSAFEEKLIFRYTAGEETLFDGIYKLLPGQVLICESGQIHKEFYWNPLPPENFEDIDEATALEQLESLLKDSVQYRLMSDVPLGTFCSGGVDSGLTTAFAKDLHQSELNTFSIGFHEPEWDESPYANMMADRFKTRHHVIKIDSKSYADSLPMLNWYHDEPLIHPSSPLGYFVSKLARKYVTVVLTGDGSDELFGGYPRFLIARVASYLSLLPGFAQKLIGNALLAMPARKAKKMGYYFGQSLLDVGLYNANYASKELVNSLLTTESNGNGEGIRYRRGLLETPNLSRHNLMEQSMFLDIKTYIPAALYGVDRMTMANSIEGRVPFLDYRLVEFALNLGTRLKIKGTQTKYLVKKLGEKMLPHECIYRQKVGFGTPVDLWFRDKAGIGRYLELFFDSEFRNRDGMRADRVQQVINEHLSGNANHGELLWNITNLELWHRIYIDKTLNPVPITE